MRILFTSDTHNNLPNLVEIADQFDIVFFCGDVNSYWSSGNGPCSGELMVYKALDDMAQAIGKPVYFLRGNHDEYIHQYPFKNVTVFLDTGLIVDDVNKLNILYADHVNIEGFVNSKTEEQQEEMYTKIVEAIAGTKIHIIVTHQPPYGILDACNYHNIGSKPLLKLVKTVKPLIHVFGHIHEGFGSRCVGPDTEFLNVSYCNYKNQPMSRVVLYNSNTGSIELLNTTNIKLG